MAADKKNAKRLGAHLVFIDESGFLLLPHLRRTWAPRGRTPLHRHRYQRDKVSVISGISVSPRRQRLGLYFQFHGDNLRQAEVCAFLRQLLHQLRGAVIVIWDNGTIHKGAPIRELCRCFPRLRLEALPPYAPELNPDEGVWAQAKRQLANGRPDNLSDLLDEMVDVFAELSVSQPRLKACIEHSDLPLFLRRL